MDEGCRFLPFFVELGIPLPTSAVASVDKPAAVDTLAVPSCGIQLFCSPEVV